MTINSIKSILSIDSEKEVSIIYLSFQSKKREVEDFLKELNNLLGKIDFDISKDLILISKRKPMEDMEYSTPFTLLDLEYDVLDVVKRLKELRVEEYSETKIDRDNVHPPILFVFGKDINGRLIYIKLKITDQEKKVLCVSFHYAKKEMLFPYA